jgi:hypothetical protein
MPSALVQLRHAVTLEEDGRRRPSFSRHEIRASRKVGSGCGGHAAFTRSFDFPARECHEIAMKAAKPTGETKTPGATAVEKRRPLMNRLTSAERRRLRQRTAELLYGHETVTAGR